MIPAGVILDDVAFQTNDPRGTADAKWKALLLAKINEAYREVAASFSWSTLKATVTLEDEVYRLPGDCLNLLRVIDGDKIIYGYVGGPKRRSAYYKNWYYAAPVSSALASGTTLAISEYATAAASTAEFPSTTCAGEYIRIAGNAGVYQISAWTSSSAITLAANYRGKAEAQATFQIRPVGTRVIAFSDATGADLTPSDVDVDYVKQPLPLWRDEDMIELPGDCSAVRIRALQKVLALLKRDWEATRMQPDYIAALGQMKSLEQNVPQMRPNALFQRRDIISAGTLRERLIGGYGV